MRKGYRKMACGQGRNFVKKDLFAMPVLKRTGREVKILSLKKERLDLTYNYQQKSLSSAAGTAEGKGILYALGFWRRSLLACTGL